MGGAKEKRQKTAAQMNSPVWCISQGSAALGYEGRLLFMRETF